MAKTKVQPEVSRAPSSNGTLKAKDSVLLDSLPSTLAGIFSQSQHSLTTHRKLVNQLHKLFIACCAVQETAPGARKGDDERIKLTGEKAFRDGVLEMLDRVVACKKGVVQADRVVKFVAAYCGFASEHDPEAEQAGEDEQTPTGRFLVRLAKYLVGGFEAKNKFVRWRCVQLLAYVVESMHEMDDDLFCELRDRLLIRARDKEAIVRQQAAIALMKFRPVDDQDEEDEDEEEVNETLIDLMIHDPAPDVRRTVLHNLAGSPSPVMLPNLLTRLRDVDPLTRRTLYRDLIACTSASSDPSKPSALPSDPSRAFSLSERLNILRGLKDREPGVQKEASWLVAAWIRDGCAGSVEHLLSSLDVVEQSASSSSSGVPNVAEAAIIAWVNQLPSSGATIGPFDEAWWGDLNPEKAFFLRVLVEHFQKQGDDKALDEVMPVVMALAFRSEQAFNELVALLESAADGEETETEGSDDEEQPRRKGKGKANREAEEKAFMVGELMKVAMHADYGDEIGRRKMFTLLRNMISHPRLPSSLIPGILDALLKLSSGEKDFMRVVVELVQELMESAGGDASLAGRNETATDDEGEDEEDEDAAAEGEDGEGGMRIRRKKPVKVAAIVLDTEKTIEHLRTLSIVHALLERVLGSIQENTSLYGIVHELIIPAVRSKQPEIREQGLLCLGMCCLLDKGMATDSFPLLAHQSKEAEGEVQIKVLQILFDLFMLYGLRFLEAKNIEQDQVVTFLMEKLDDRPEVQATAAVGFSKLMLAGVVTDVEVLKALVLVYFSPETSGNQQLRQCLSYFFPVYCYSSPANQRRLQSVILEAVDILDSVYDEQEDKAQMLQPNQIALQLIDWSDPGKAVETPGVTPDPEVHLELAVGMVQELYKRTDKDYRKMLCQLLSKLTFPDEVDDMRLRGLLLLLDNLQERQPLTDSVSRNALSRFETSLKKRFGDRISVLDEAELRQTEVMTSFFKYIEDFDAGSPHGSDEEQEEDDTDEEDEEADYRIKTPAKVPKGKKPNGKSRASILSRASSLKPRGSIAASSDAGSDSTATVGDTPAPRRSGRERRPKSSAHEQSIQEEIDSLIGSDSEEEDEDDE